MGITENYRKTQISSPDSESYLALPFRYLTTLQLTQFVTFFVHACFPLFFECDFPKIFSYVILFHGALFFLLFANFYIQAYMKKGSRTARKPVEKTDINANTPLKQD